MCVIVHQPIGQSLDKKTADKLWKRNSDGGGFAYVDDKNVINLQKYMNFNAFWKDFETARSQYPGRDFLLHMRIATHGSVSLDNVHPFIVDDYTVMAHNGIIRGVIDDISKEDDRSDTRFFIEEVLPSLPETWLDNPYLRDMVDEWIGWSKLMFLTTNPALSQRVYKLGTWDSWHGLPMSNTSGLFETKTTTYTSTPSKVVDDNGVFWDKDTYKVPLPNPQTTTQTTEWLTWLDYKNMFQKENGTWSGGSFLKTDLDLLIEAMTVQRKAMGNPNPLVIADPHLPDIQCGQCTTEIDLDTCECWCFEVVCKTCWQFLAHCPNSNECNKGGIIDYEQLTDKGKEFVRDGGLSKYTGDDKKIMEAALSKGA